jgi:hypothetical protein
MIPTALFQVVNTAKKQKKNPPQTRFLERLPFEHIAKFLTAKDVFLNLTLVSKTFKSSCDNQLVSRALFLSRNPLLERPYAHHYAQNWKSLLINVIYRDLRNIRCLHPSNVYIELISDYCEYFSPASGIPGFSMKRLQPACSFEIFPDFFWNVCETSGGIIHSGIAVRGGIIINEKGIQTLSVFLSDKMSHVNELDEMTWFLLLTHFDCLPMKVPFSYLTFTPCAPGDLVRLSLPIVTENLPLLHFLKNVPAGCREDPIDELGSRFSNHCFISHVSCATLRWNGSCLNWIFS